MVAWALSAWVFVPTCQSNDGPIPLKSLDFLWKCWTLTKLGIYPRAYVSHYRLVRDIVGRNWNLLGTLIDVVGFARSYKSCLNDKPGVKILIFILSCNEYKNSGIYYIVSWDIFDLYSSRNLPWWIGHSTHYISKPCNMKYLELLKRYFYMKWKGMLIWLLLAHYPIQMASITLLHRYSRRSAWCWSWNSFLNDIFSSIDIWSTNTQSRKNLKRLTLIHTRWIVKYPHSRNEHEGWANYWIRPQPFSALSHWAPWLFEYRDLKQSFRICGWRLFHRCYMFRTLDSVVSPWSCA